MSRTIYARVFAPDPQHEVEGKYVRLMIYEGEGYGHLIPSSSRGAVNCLDTPQPAAT